MTFIDWRNWFNTDLMTTLKIGWLRMFLVFISMSFIIRGIGIIFQEIFPVLVDVYGSFALSSTIFVSSILYIFIGIPFIKFMFDQYKPMKSMKYYQVILKDHTNLNILTKVLDGFYIY
jgi:hypothetical protein